MIENATELCQEFAAWRARVDCDELLDTFDLALGWFSGKGLEHEHALALTRAVVDGEYPKDTELK